LVNFPLVVLPALALFSALDTDAVWWALVIGEVLCVLIIFIMAFVKKRGFPFRAKDFLFLKEPFGVPEEDIMDFSITKQEEVIAASTSIQEFCEKKGASEKQSMLMGLYVEELSINIIKFGFSDGKSHSIDVRVMKRSDGWTLRIRDDCKKFDPTEWIKLHSDDDPTKNIGIRMVCGMAKKVNYISTLDLNNLNISL
jgi:anti-sigma regulatory factor (Ser/Thr protein kinase)